MNNTQSKKNVKTIKSINKYNIIGAIFVTIGCFNTSVKDTADKILVMQDYNPLEIIWFRFSLPFILFALIMPKTTFKAVKGTNRILSMRGVCFLVCSTLAVTTLKFIPLGIYTIIIQLSPICLVIASVIFFKEKLTGLKIISIIMGFVGVAIVLHPSGEEGLSWWYISPFIIMIFAVGFNLLTKKVPKSYDSLSILINVMFMLSIVPSISLIVHPSIWTTPTLHDLIFFLLIPFTTLVSQFSYIKAMQYGEASYVAPFFYMQMVFSLIFSLFVFNERLNLYNIIGCIIILVSALLITFSGIKPIRFLKKRRLTNRKKNQTK